jgi:hypothetical protein
MRKHHGVVGHCAYPGRGGGHQEDDQPWHHPSLVSDLTVTAMHHDLNMLECAECLGGNMAHEHLTDDMVQSTGQWATAPGKVMHNADMDQRPSVSKPGDVHPRLIRGHA